MAATLWAAGQAHPAPVMPIADVRDRGERQQREQERAGLGVPGSEHGQDQVRAAGHDGPSPVIGPPSDVPTCWACLLEYAADEPGVIMREEG